MTPDKVSESTLSIGVSVVAGGALVRVLGQPIFELVSQMVVHKMTAQIQPSEVSIVTRSALGKLFVLGVRLVDWGVSILAGGSFATTSLGTAHVDD